MYRGPEESLQQVHENLDPERIRLQRERLGLTGRELADKVGVSPSAISQFERAVSSPDMETLIQISIALDVPVKFFLDRDSNVRIPLDRCHFRSKRGVPQYKRRQSTSRASLLLQLISYLEQRKIRFPDEQLSGFIDSVEGADQDTPVDYMEEMATKLRKHWGMGLGPIPNLVSLLESKGILVLPLDKSHEDVDAFSLWHKDRPVILLTQQKAASRDRLDAGHELCHLTLHSNAERDLKVIEDQAFRFGAAFLAPRKSFLPECPRRWSYPAFLELKKRWKMSMQALARRAYDLDRISESSYRSANIDLRKRFYADGYEEGEWDTEKPLMIEQAIDLLKDEITLDDLAHHIGIHESGPMGVKSLLSKCVNESTLEKIESNSGVDEQGQIVTLSND